MLVNRRTHLRHLLRALGYAGLSIPALTVLQHCREDSPPPAPTPERATLRRLVDELLPRTDTPGALDVGVDDFVASAFPIIYGPEFNAEFQTALGELAAKNGRLTDLPAQLAGPFRRLSLLGFFTSETIMTEELNFQPAPGHYEGCVPVGRLSANLNA